MNVTIENIRPSADEYNKLREAVNWDKINSKMIEVSFTNSIYISCVRIDNNLVGMGRIIGDGGMFYYIQDVIVLPEYQGKGIGAKIMDELMGYIQLYAQHMSVIGLMSSIDKESLYERYGFLKRPNHFLGCGMTMLIEK